MHERRCRDERDLKYLTVDLASPYISYSAQAMWDPIRSSGVKRRVRIFPLAAVQEYVTIFYDLIWTGGLLPAQYHRALKVQIKIKASWPKRFSSAASACSKCITHAASSI